MTQHRYEFEGSREGLRTSRQALGQERGVLAVLRALAPRRRLTELEGKIIAELQANRLLELARAEALPVPVELITQLPRIVVREDGDLPSSAMTQWINGRWLIALNSGEPATRLRFSLGHELKHIIDHRFVAELYGSQAQAERVADHFSACLWMPKRKVLQAWGSGVQSLAELAMMFDVSQPAMARRLQYLGLRSALHRPVGLSTTPARRQTRYYRLLTTEGVL